MKQAFLFIIFFCGLAFPAKACECLAPTLEQGKKSYDGADIVIKAKILSVSAGWGSTSPIVKLQVNNVIKGDNVPNIITANYNENHVACGNEFTLNQTAIIALYDTRPLMVTAANMRGYGFRVMMSCHQDQVRYYLKKQPEKEK